MVLSGAGWRIRVYFAARASVDRDLTLLSALTACTQVENRNLWGDVIYTCDSDLAVALLHQGYYSQNHMHPPNQVGKGMGRGRGLVRGMGEADSGLSRGAGWVGCPVMLLHKS